LCNIVPGVITGTASVVLFTVYTDEIPARQSASWVVLSPETDSSEKLFSWVAQRAWLLSYSDCGVVPWALSTMLLSCVCKTCQILKMTTS
jgi:hypothetical protein